MSRRFTSWVPIFAGGVAVLLTPAQVGPQSPQPHFRAAIDLVRLEVLVTRDSRPVRGLGAEDFLVKDNGVVQAVTLATTVNQVNVILALDTSSSVAGNTLSQLQQATGALVGSLSSGDTLSLITFSDRLNLAAEHTGDFRRALDAIGDVRCGGRTAVRDAVYAAIRLAPDSDRSILILFTDGADDASWLSEAAVIDSLKRSRVTAYVVANPDIDLASRSLLQAVADQSAGQLFSTRQPQLTRVFLSILDECRSRYLLTYEPTGVKRDDGWHRVAVALRVKSGLVRARQTYFAGDRRLRYVP